MIFFNIPIKFLPVFIFVNLYMSGPACVWGWMSVCVYTCKCMHVHMKPEVNLRSLSSCLLRWGLSLVWNSPSRLETPASELQESCLCPSSTKEGRKCHPSWPFMWMLGIKCRASYSQGKPFADEPSPQFSTPKSLSFIFTYQLFVKY